MTTFDRVQSFWHQAHLHPDYQSLLEQLIPESFAYQSSKLAELPRLLYSAAGGDEHHLDHVLAAWLILRQAARLLDDLEEDDALQTAVSKPIGLNASTGLLFTVGGLLNELESTGIEAETATAIRSAFYSRLLEVCSGQHQDLSNRVTTLEESWRMTNAKSGAFVALICWAAGRLAMVSEAQLTRYETFGSHLGLLDQIRDDFLDLWPTDETQSDLENGRLNSLPVTYALSVLPSAQRARLQNMIEADHLSSATAEETRQIIIESGAGLYLAVQSAAHQKACEQLLVEMDLPPAIHAKLSAFVQSLNLPIAA